MSPVIARSNNRASALQLLSCVVLVESDCSGEIHSLTPWSRVLLEKLIGFQLVKKFSALYGTWRFITAFTSACHMSLLSQPNPIHTPTSWRSILILTSHLCLDLPRGVYIRFPHQNPRFFRRNCSSNIHKQQIFVKIWQSLNAALCTGPFHCGFRDSVSFHVGYRELMLIWFLSGSHPFH